MARAKLATMPKLMPNGRPRPGCVAVVDKIIGSSGQMQGDKIVTNPAANATANKSNMGKSIADYFFPLIPCQK
ncbi:MAG: hypothetical protein M1484_00785 [Patescibacteria group bacterium]|nr:hypothetical protein [Patescibacteria group bacterium]MCL5431615.1 hypothetical protein [Patescibacteria group bacterium]